MGYFKCGAAHLPEGGDKQHDKMVLVTFTIMNLIFDLTYIYL